MGAAFNSLMEEETKESLAKMCCKLMDEIASMKLSRQYEFLNENFLALMNGIGRLGHEKFGADAFEVAGVKERKILRHRKYMILWHARQHLFAYEAGVKHDELGTMQAHLGAVAFNCMLEYIFSQGE